MAMNTEILLPAIRKTLPITLAHRITGVQPMPGDIMEIFNKIHPHKFNARYWPYSVEIETFDMFDAERWCYNNFKSRNWRNRGKHFAFKHEKDYVAFLLKWSQ